MLLCIVDIHNGCAWVNPCKDKKGITVTNACQKFLHDSNCNKNKIWVYKGSECQNRWMKSWLQDVIEIYSTYKEGKSVFDFSTKKVYIDKLGKIVNICNNRYHRTIKIRSVDLKSSTYIAFVKENNKENLWSNQ